jgi:hypothetical protein
MRARGGVFVFVFAFISAVVADETGDFYETYDYIETDEDREHFYQQSKGKD